MMIKPRLPLPDANRYLKLQGECGLCVGDIVKVVREAKTHEDGWNNSWVPEMDSIVGQVRTVMMVGESGIRLARSGGFSFPFFVLEPVKSIKECNVDD